MRKYSSVRSHVEDDTFHLNENNLLDPMVQNEIKELLKLGPHADYAEVDDLFAKYQDIIFNNICNYKFRYDDADNVDCHQIPGQIQYKVTAFHLAILCKSSTFLDKLFHIKIESGREADFQRLVIRPIMTISKNRSARTRLKTCFEPPNDVDDEEDMEEMDDDLQNILPKGLAPGMRAIHLVKKFYPEFLPKFYKLCRYLKADLLEPLINSNDIDIAKEYLNAHINLEVTEDNRYITFDLEPFFDNTGKANTELLYQINESGEKELEQHLLLTYFMMYISEKIYMPWIEWLINITFAFVTGRFALTVHNGEYSVQRDFFYGATIAFLVVMILQEIWQFVHNGLTRHFSSKENWIQLTVIVSTIVFLFSLPRLAVSAEDMRNTLGSIRPSLTLVDASRESLLSAVESLNIVNGKLQNPSKAKKYSGISSELTHYRVEPIETEDYKNREGTRHIWGAASIFVQESLKEIGGASSILNSTSLNSKRALLHLEQFTDKLGHEREKIEEHSVAYQDLLSINQFLSKTSELIKAAQKILDNVAGSMEAVKISMTELESLRDWPDEDIIDLVKQADRNISRAYLFFKKSSKFFKEGSDTWTLSTTPRHSPGFNYLACFCVFSAYLGAVVIVGKTRTLGIYILMLSRTLRKSLALLFIYLNLIQAFAYAFLLLVDEKQLTIFHAISKVVYMMVGAVNYNDTFPTHEVHGHKLFITQIIFVIFVITLPILFSNLLIGITVSDVKHMYDEAKLYQSRRQLRDIIINYRYHNSRKACKKLCLELKPYIPTLSFCETDGIKDMVNIAGRYLRGLVSAEQLVELFEFSNGEKGQRIQTIPIVIAKEAQHVTNSQYSTGSYASSTHMQWV